MEKHVMTQHFAALFLLVLVVPKCNSCTFPVDLATTPFASYKYLLASSVPSIDSVGMYSTSPVLTYTTGPITVAATETPKSYDCIQSDGDFYLFKSSQPVEDLAVGIIDVYMCQKLMRIDNYRYLVYYFGERTAENPVEFALTKGTATFRQAGASVPNDFICELCRPHMYRNTVFPLDFPAYLIVFGGGSPSLTRLAPGLLETSACVSPSKPTPSTPSPSTPTPSTPSPSTPTPSTPSPSRPTPSTPRPSTPIPITTVPVTSPTTCGTTTKPTPNELQTFCQTFVNNQLTFGNRYARGKRDLRSYFSYINARSNGNSRGNGKGKNSHSSEQTEEEPCTCPDGAELKKFFQSFLKSCKVMLERY